MKFILRFLFVFTLAFVAFGLQGCGKKTTALETQCVTNSDQTATFTGHWTARPIPIALEAVDFSPADQAAIAAAATTWNDFFNASKTFEIYNTGSSSSVPLVNQGSRPTSSTICSQPMVSPAGFTQKIVIYKVSSGWNYGPGAIAVTSTCPAASSGQFKNITAAMMQVNYQNYFVAGAPVPDLQSILTHELGHMLGLGHSCGNFTNGSPPVDCSNQDYQSAIMYPQLGFQGIYGQVKRDLQQNDEGRANCLY